MTESISDGEAAGRFHATIDRLTQHRRESDSTFQRLILWGLWILIHNVARTGGFKRSSAENFRAEALAYVDREGGDLDDYKDRHSEMLQVRC